MPPQQIPSDKNAERPRIGEMLVEQGLISEGQLKDALRMQKDQGGKVVENLIALRHLDTREFLNFLSRQPGTASINLLNYEIPEKIVQMVPPEFALKHELMPIDKLGKDLTVGMACPLDQATIKKLEEMTGLRVRPLLVSMNDIRVALDRYYRPKQTATFQLDQRFHAANPAAPPEQPPQHGTPAPHGALPPQPGFGQQPQHYPQHPHAQPPQHMPHAPQHQTAPPPPGYAQQPPAPQAPPYAPHPQQQPYYPPYQGQPPHHAPQQPHSHPQAPPAPPPQQHAPQQHTPPPPGSAQAYPPPQIIPDLAKAESGLRFEGVVHVVRQIHSLPALPETVSQVRAAMENPDAAMSEVAKIVGRDPGLTAKVLSLANSASYGFSHHVDSIDLAVTLLGLRETFNCVLSCAVIDYFSKSRYFDYRAFWKRSMFCGTAARIISKERGQRTLSGAFTAGLLHDIGRVVFAEVAPDRYRDVDQSLRDNQIIAREQELFGVAHPEIGYILADTWDLPAEISEPIRFHHDIRSADKSPELVATVALAALMTDAYGRVTRDNVRNFVAECKEALQVLGLTEKQFIAILGETGNAVKQDLAGQGEQK